MSYDPSPEWAEVKADDSCKSFTVCPNCGKTNWEEFQYGIKESMRGDYYTAGCIRPEIPINCDCGDYYEIVIKVVISPVSVTYE